MKRTAESDISDVAQKKPRYDEGASQKLKSMISKYGAGGQLETGGQGMGANIKDLSDELNKNKIAEIKKKILAKRRTRIKGDGDEGEKGLSSLGDMDSDR